MFLRDNRSRASKKKKNQAIKQSNLFSKWLILYNCFCIRFNRLISKNLSIQIESDTHLNTKENSLNWLNCLTSFSVLGSLFIINQVFHLYELKLLRTTLALIVCFFLSWTTKKSITCDTLLKKTRRKPKLPRSYACQVMVKWRAPISV